MVYKWMHEKSGVTDETCQPYQAKSNSCSNFDICRDCQHNGKCFAVKNPTKFKISEYGFVRGEHQMMAEIKSRGPISCRQAVTKEFFNYRGGIFKDMTGDTRPRHATSLVGWGKTGSGTKYWIARNSWGTYWGESGYFKVERGINQLGIEDECSWGVPAKTGVIKEGSQESLMGFEDHLVTSTDLGASIDGSESMIQEASNRAPVKPSPVVGKDDDHSSSFFNKKSSNAWAQEQNEKDNASPQPMNADEDPAFKHQQSQDGVGY